MNPSSYFLVRLKDTYAHQLAITTSLLCHRICVFLLQLRFLWCLIIHPAGMCMPHKSHRGSASFPSCTTTTVKKKCLYTKCSLRRPDLCVTVRQPVTGHLTVFSTWGKETT